MATKRIEINPMQLLHWGPIIALSVIFLISAASVRNTLMWWPIFTLGGVINLMIFLLWNVLTLYNYLLAAFKGPGFVPLGWEPEDEEDKQYLQYCNLCEGYKSPRSHHCRKCDRCVIKMDHHCPWINTCCGHFNHGNFTWFLFFAPIGCVHALFILIPSTYRAINWQYYFYYTREPVVYLGLFGFIGTMFAIGLAVGVTLAVGMLYVIQMRSIIKNETGIESWIIEKALDRDRDDDEEFMYPYNLGWKANLAEVFTWTGYPKSDGVVWNVRDECNQFTLTIEQIQQKAQKRDRTFEYSIIEDYSGAWFPITKGCRVCIRFPCTDEPRIPVTKGDKVLVTRWKRHWLYGTRLKREGEIKEGSTKKRYRGWFPRRCAVEVICDDQNHAGEDINENKKDK
ncbi:palmitoyltransferase ZDHHC6-like [Mytilus galloprovincialis]|uniref:palmitoyltransferase ZDHHC6-like n=1 Tax=Mytilus galloprovincialis TaxID=29158 RepID=UPI003F7C9146